MGPGATQHHELMPQGNDFQGRWRFPAAIIILRIYLQNSGAGTLVRMLNARQSGFAFAAFAVASLLLCTPLPAETNDVKDRGETCPWRKFYSRLASLFGASTASACPTQADMRIARFSRVALVALLLMFIAADARAQSELEVPVPSGQTGVPITPRKPAKRPTPGSALELPQQTPALEEQASPREEAPEPPPENELSEPEPEAETKSPAPRPIPLPEIFRGCWEGVVRELDSIHRLPGARPIGPWVAKTYRLCYRRVGNGPFEPTFGEAGVKRSRMITNPEGRLKVLSTDGRSYARMSAFLHFDEYRKGSHRRETFGVDEVTNLMAEIDQSTMLVRAKVYGERDGEPWFRATWHANFTRAPD